MKTLLARGLVALVPFLAACGGATPTVTTTPEMEDRAVTGSICVAEYGRAQNLTIVAVDLESLGVAGVAIPGDGWNVDCTSAQDALVTATHEATGRIMTIMIDRGSVGAVDVAQYANEHVAAMRAGGGPNGLTVADPLVAETGYAVMSRLDRGEGSLFDLSIYELLPTPQGALRMHLSEFSSNPESIQEHAELLAECSDTFRFDAGADD